VSFQAGGSSFQQNKRAIYKKTGFAGRAALSGLTGLSAGIREINGCSGLLKRSVSFISAWGYLISVCISLNRIPTVQVSDTTDVAIKYDGRIQKPGLPFRPLRAARPI
jgi:hypothetical protein